MEYLLPAFIGIGLSAACGFRVLVPPFVMSLSSQLGFGTYPLTEDLGWLASWPATVALGIGVIVEVGAYYIPWVDNLLDTISTPASVVAGSLVTGTMLGDADPVLKWAAAIIAGGGVAGAVQVGTVSARAASTATTGGLGNPAVSTAEVVSALLLSVLAITLPVVAFLAVLVLLSWAWRKLRGGSRKEPSAAG